MPRDSGVSVRGLSSYAPRLQRNTSLVCSERNRSVSRALQSLYQAFELATRTGFCRVIDAVKPRSGYRNAMDDKRILVTSALPYINGVKHLGNLAGSMLPADVYARFQRQRLGANNVLFICATDEHGTPAELAALEEGKGVQDYCDYWHAEQKRIYDGFHLSFDHFGRSSSFQNRALTQEFARTLWEAGFIEERVTLQVYSSADQRFLPDRYVIGTCPHCGYEHARGDQCENCTRVLDPADLINPRSAISGSPI